MTLKEKPLVYSCSGGSNVAQLANDIAVVMGREGLAQMSCIAGVGGDVKKMVRIATSGRDICAIDGCALACVKKTLARHNVTPKWHVELTGLGLVKRDGEACTISEHYHALRHVYRTTGLVEDGKVLNSDIA
ncbi:putative zinc-binding protein [Marinimicrobium sp. ABcell2]|uniref:putative zinc-binding protein n=1 Tax=Marinimicrobium sp. ABcell2 TaxID=3069751 RepID=UPI0027ADBF1B|nr:putative zinc-binding protein [Marinimicrobium sp. ABcell2]MDQ2076425.1 putative zinc-binding protein [Marinimicrobium sp. ABcell2]